MSVSVWPRIDRRFVVVEPGQELADVMALHGVIAVEYRVLPGTYNWSQPIDLRSAQHVAILGSRGTRINLGSAAAPLGVPFFLIGDAGAASGDYIEIAGMYLRAHTTSYGVQGRTAAGSSSWIVLRDLYYHSSGGAGASAFLYGRFTNLRVEACEIWQAAATLDAGINILAGSGNRIRDNRLTIGGAGACIRVTGPAEWCDVSNNECFSGAGIYLTATEESTCRGNYVNGSGSHGITLAATSARVVVEGNRISYTTGDGINCAGTQCTLRGNSMYLVGGRGINVPSGSKSNVIVGNMIRQSNNEAILCSSSNNVLSANVCSNNTAGDLIYCASDAYNAVTGNNLENSDDSAIRIQGDYTAVTGNMIEEPGTDGIRIENTAEHCSVNGNVVESAGGDGIVVAGDETTVVGNNVGACVGDGIQIDASADRTHYGGNNLRGNGVAINDNGTNSSAFDNQI